MTEDEIRNEIVRKLRFLDTLPIEAKNDYAKEIDKLIDVLAGMEHQDDN